MSPPAEFGGRHACGPILTSVEVGFGASSERAVLAAAEASWRAPRRFGRLRAVCLQSAGSSHTRPQAESLWVPGVVALVAGRGSAAAAGAGRARVRVARVLADLSAGVEAGRAGDGPLAAGTTVRTREVIAQVWDARAVVGGVVALRVAIRVHSTGASFVGALEESARVEAEAKRSICWIHAAVPWRGGGQLAGTRPSTRVRPARVGSGARWLARLRDNADIVQTTTFVQGAVDVGDAVPARPSGDAPALDFSSGVHNAETPWSTVDPTARILASISIRIEAQVARRRGGVGPTFTVGRTRVWTARVCADARPIGICGVDAFGLVGGVDHASTPWGTQHGGARVGGAARGSVRVDALKEGRHRDLFTLARRTTRDGVARAGAGTVGPRVEAFETRWR